MRVLLVEDDDSIAVPLAKGLVRAGFEVERAATGGEALAQGEVDVVLLDIGLPDMDGFELCRELRARSPVPIIAITARGEEADRVRGLELGADDYMVKPFGFRELLARIGAVTRRFERRHDADADADEEMPIRVGPIEIDRRVHRVTLRGSEVALTPKEYDILAFLASDPGALLTRVQIITSVWDAHWYGPTKTLDVHVASLRKKLGVAGFVENVRGIGFRLNPEALEVNEA